MPKDEKKPSIPFEKLLERAGSKPDPDAALPPPSEKFDPKKTVIMPDGEDPCIGK